MGRKRLRGSCEATGADVSDAPRIPSPRTGMGDVRRAGSRLPPIASISQWDARRSAKAGAGHVPAGAQAALTVGERSRRLPSRSHPDEVAPGGIPSTLGRPPARASGVGVGLAEPRGGTFCLSCLAASSLDCVADPGHTLCLAQGARRSLGRWPGLKRRFLYADPRHYWTLRGGDDYFREQEGQPTRTERAEWLAGRIASYRPGSILEVGCGYGKQLRAIRRRIDVPMVGVDFSPTQLWSAREYLDGLDGSTWSWPRGPSCPSPTARSTWC